VCWFVFQLQLEVQVVFDGQVEFVVQEMVVVQIVYEHVQVSYMVQVVVEHVKVQRVHLVEFGVWMKGWFQD
jgi:hypothetical protein